MTEMTSFALTQAQQALMTEVLALPFHRFAELELEQVMKGEARLAFVARDQLLAPGGYLHGGVMAGLLEPPTLMAALTYLEPHENPVTVDVHVQHLRAVQKGQTVTLIGRVLRRSRHLLFCEAEALVDGEQMSLGRMTKAIGTKQASAPKP